MAFCMRDPILSATAAKTSPELADAPLRCMPGARIIDPGAGGADRERLVRLCACPVPGMTSVFVCFLIVYFLQLGFGAERMLRWLNNAQSP